MSGKEEQIKQIYNDCWLIYKDYLYSHDMRQYNEQAEELVSKYKGCHEVVGLLWWFTPIVNELHEEYVKSIAGDRKDLEK